MPTRPVDSQSLSKTRGNQIAAGVLSRARRSTGLSQERFLAAIGEWLGTRPYAQNALSAWEAGERSVPAAVMIAAAEVAKAGGFELSDALDLQAQELPVSLHYLWITARVSLPRRASSAEQRALGDSIISAYNSRLKKPSEVAWSPDGRSAIVSMAAGGYIVDEITESVKDMIKRHVSRGASIVSEREADVAILRTAQL